MRYHDQCPVQVLGDGARPAISVFRSASYTLLITLEPLERHAYGSQAFMAVAGDSVMVVVAPAGETQRADDVRAFRTWPSERQLPWRRLAPPDAGT